MHEEVVCNPILSPRSTGVTPSFSLYNKTADSLVGRRLRIGLRKDRIKIGNISVSDKDFIAIDNIFVPLFLQHEYQGNGYHFRDSVRSQQWRQRLLLLAIWEDISSFARQ
jgi:hypothetical protein